MRWSKRPVMIKQAVVVMFALSVLFSIGCSQRGEDPRTQPELVRLYDVEAAKDADPSFTGVVTARVQSDLGFRVSGKVTRRFVDVGQTVLRGQPLMRIDVTDFEHVITSQTQAVEAAKAKAQQASADEARYRGLVATGAVSASTYDQIKAQADAANAELASAEAQERVAKDQGDYSFLVADANGTIVQTFAEPGQVVAAGQTVIKLAHSGPREAAVYLPETIRPLIGSIARATLYGKTESVPARLRQLSDSADLETRTFEARYVLGGKEANAPLGATVTIQLAEPALPGSIAVPNASITDRGNGPGVWVYDRIASTVSFRPVKILRLSEEDAYLKEGVHPGDEVVALGAHLLNPGQHVRTAAKETASR